MENKPTYQVYTISEHNEKKHWNQIGVAFKNKDDSFNVILNAMPFDGRLHIRQDSKQNRKGRAS